MTIPNRPQTCRQCGNPLPPPLNTGRTRQYCSGTCRSAARRDRSQQIRNGKPARPDVHENLTSVARKASIDVVVNETSGDTVSVMAGGQEAARRLLSQLLAGPDNPLDVIAFIQGAMAEIGEGMQTAVQRARDSGRTWAEVGQVLGISRQAAFQRFGRPADPRTGQPMALSMLPGAADRGAALLADLLAGRWARVSRDFTETVARRLDADGVALMWARLTGLLGQLENTGAAVAFQAGDHSVVDIPLSFEAAERTARISYTSDGKVAGLHFLPPGFT